MSVLKKILFLFPTIFFLVLIALFIILFDIKQVHGNSMYPSYKKGDWILIATFYNEKSFFSSHKKIFCGDVLIFRHPQTDEVMMKRVIATEGTPLKWIASDTLQIGTETVKISPNKKYLFNDFTKVPKHAIFFLGDNRDQSSDSRVFGLVSIDRIEGKVLFGRKYENRSTER